MMKSPKQKNKYILQKIIGIVTSERSQYFNRIKSLENELYQKNREKNEKKR